MAVVKISADKMLTGKMERYRDQVIYVIRIGCLKEFGAKTQARLCRIGTPKPIPQSRQEHDENENRC